MTMGNYYSSYYKAKSFEKHVANENNILPLDKRLLSELLSIQAPSEYEKEMQDFIIAWVQDNVPTAKIKIDHYGNLLITKGKSNTFPCVVAHMDEVNDFQTDRLIIELGNMFIGMNRLTGEPAGCPGDDRVGCYVALEMLRIIPNIKVAFFVEEEIGGKGSYACNMDFFTDVAFVLQADRNNNYEIITQTNGSVTASVEFEGAMSKYMSLYNYEFSTGTFTDAGVLANRGIGVSCINMGCGYYDAHSESEKVVLPDVENVLNLTYFFCIYLAYKKWKHKVEHVFKKTKPRYKIPVKGKVSPQMEYNAATGKTEVIERDEDDEDSPFDPDFDFAVSDDFLPQSSLDTLGLDDIPCKDCRTYDCANCEYSQI